MIQTIPLAKLVPSKRNVRRRSDAAADAQLRADIEARGLLQNLIVTANKKPRGTFAVEAGGRRHAALKALAEEGKLAADFAVPCLVLDDLGSAVAEASLAENFQKLALNPADECLAFQHFIEQGSDVDGVARRFGVTVRFDVLGLGMLGCMNRAFKTQPLATVPTFRCNRAIERVGRLCLRHPLPAVVFAEDAPIAAVIQVDDTVTALGFDLPIFLNVVGRQHFGADTVILTGYFFIPVPDVATGDRWNHVIQNSHRNVEGTTLQTSDGEWVIRYEWSAPKRAFSWFRRS